MFRYIVLIVLTLFSKTVFGQFALINDKDGYCNIRDSSSAKSKIIDKLANNKIVYCLQEDNFGEWYPIDYTKNGVDKTGFIHKSRVVFLSKLSKIKTLTTNGTTLNTVDDTFKLNIITGKFELKKHSIKYEKPKNESRYVSLIDNDFPWGTDGNIPKNEYKKIELKIGDSLTLFDKTNYKDLFEPNLENTKVYFDKFNTTYYLTTDNSDGAGGYSVAWIIKNNRLVNREIFRGF